MKTAKTLLSLIFGMLLISTVAAAVSVDTAWISNNASNLAINNGDSATFEVYAFTSDNSVNVRIEIFNSSDNLVYTILPLTSVSGHQHIAEYTITPNEYNNTLGVYTVLATASDSTTTRSNEITLNVVAPGSDLSAPTIIIQTPTNGATYSTLTNTLNFIATDTNLASCEYSTDNGVSRNTIACTSGATTTIPLTANEGANTWRVYARDVVGNEGTASVTFNVDTSLPDTTAPVITITSPTSVAYTTHNMAFNILTDENATVTASINGGTAIPMANPTDHIFTYNANLANGNYAVTFYATDASNNVGTASVSFTVNHEDSSSSSSSHNHRGTADMVFPSTAEDLENEDLTSQSDSTGNVIVLGTSEDSQSQEELSFVEKIFKAIADFFKWLFGGK